MSAAFSKYPGHAGLISLALNVVCTINAVHCKDDLHQNRDETLSVASELLQCVFKSLAAIGHKAKLQQKALKIVAMLLKRYPDHLPRTCDMNSLACLINEVSSDVETTFQAGRDVVEILKLLDQHQLEELSTRGVYKHLRRHLSCYEGMEAQKYEPLVLGVSMFTIITPCTNEIVVEEIHIALIHAARIFISSSAIQTVIWNILALHCQESNFFIDKLLAEGVLDAVGHALQQNNQETMESVLRFLIACSNSTPNSLWKHCLQHDALMKSLVNVIGGNSCGGEDNIANVCGLLASMCECGSSPKVVEYNLVRKLEDCARQFPRTCSMPAIIGILGLLDQLERGHPDDKDILKACFFSENHHLFIRDMLSNNDVVSNSFLVELIYGSFVNMLKVCPPHYMPNLWSSDFVSCFVASFVRDVALFPKVANILINTALLFLFGIESKAPVEIFRDLGFHGAVTNVIVGPVSQDLLTETIALLYCILSKYQKYLTDLKPLLDCKMLDAVIQKALTFSDKEWESDCGKDMCNILLKMTGSIDMNKELFKRQYMDKFLEMLGSNLPPVTQCSIINCIGNIALSGYEAKQVLMDRMIHHMMLDTLSSGEPYIIEASCRLLQILASVEPFLHAFLEAGCTGLTVGLLESYRSNPNVCCSALGLLAVIAIKAVCHNYTSLEQILDLVIKILKTATNGKLFGSVTLVSLIIGDLDAGIVKLREMGVHRPLAVAISNTLYKRQSPNLEKWASKLIEELSLYTLGVSPTAVIQRGIVQPYKMHEGDWQPNLTSHRLQPQFPVSAKLDEAAQQQLSQLGINTGEPIFRVGRVYGRTFGTCRNCEMDGISEELVIRPHGLTPHQYQCLIDNGWYRRGGVKMFRLRQNHSVQCCDWETRVSVEKFDYKLSKQYSKVVRKMPMARLTVQLLPTHFSQDAFILYNEYNFKKHDKTAKSEQSYIEHAVDSVISNQTVDGIGYGSYHQMYLLDGKLVAVSLIDIVPKGIVSAYMWYSLDKEVSKYSLGVYSALKEIEMVQELSKTNPEMKYYYLQGWNDGNKKLAYKASYPPEEFYCACTTPEWLPSLEAVKEAKEKYLQEHTHDQNGHPSPIPIAVQTTDKDKKVSTDVLCSAFEKDRAKYEQLTGHKPDVSKIVVCLNYTTYMYLGEVFSTFSVDQSQKEIMERRFEELLVAIGPELGSQLVIDLKICTCQ